MSMSPQLRQVFSELVRRESAYFKRPDNSYDKDGILASVIQSLENEQPMLYAMFAREAVKASGHRLMTERFRKSPKRFRQADGRLIQGTLYLEIPDGEGGFNLKETEDVMLKELERKYAFHDALIRGNTLTRNYVGGIIANMRAQNLTETDVAGSVLEEVTA